MTEKRTSIFENGLIWFGAGVSLAEILTGTYFAANGHSRRQEVKELIAGLEGRYPDIKQKLFGSLQRYPLYGWNLHEEER